MIDLGSAPDIGAVIYGLSRCGNPAHKDIVTGLAAAVIGAVEGRFDRKIRRRGVAGNIQIAIGISGQITGIVTSGAAKESAEVKYGVNDKWQVGVITVFK